MDLREIGQLSFQEECQHWWIQTRFLYIDKVIDMFEQRNLVVKEFGHGSGQNIWYIQHRPNITSITGVDLQWPKNHRPDWANARTHFLSNDDQSKADLILAMDVLEHIAGDELALSQWSQLLSEGGRILLTVPAFQCLWSSHDIKLGHIKRYTRRDIETLAKKCGLEIEFSCYIFSLFMPLVYFIRKILPENSKEQTDLAPTHPLLNRLFIFIGKVEYCLKGNPFWGTSVVAILKVKHEKISQSN